MNVACVRSVDDVPFDFQEWDAQWTTSTLSACIYVIYIYIHIYIYAFVYVCVYYNRMWNTESHTYTKLQLPLAK